ncbi:MAG: class I tRNA ligase family protein [bacterium]|nr:class I tRNA ligase family protein [bacterium]
MIIPLINKEIPIITDEYVDQEFGTGALKITPCHDPHDFEIGQKHHLPLDCYALNKNGKFSKLA